MKKLEPICTTICPLLNLGMYGTNISPDMFGDSFYSCLEDDDPRTSDTEHFDFDKYCALVKVQAEQTIRDSILPTLKKFGVIDIEFGEWFHPSSYNYMSDGIDMIFTVEDNFEDIAKVTLSRVFDTDEVKEYIKDHYASRPGFVSYMPTTYTELVKFTNVYKYAAAIMLITLTALHKINLDSYQNLFEQDVYERISYEDCCTWDE